MNHPATRSLLLIVASAVASYASEPSLSTDTPTLAAILRADAASGLEKLTPAEKTALDTQIRRELDLARQGDVCGFAGTFASRRTPEQKIQTGLDKLTAEETQLLSESVALALSSQARPSPAARPRLAPNNKIDPFAEYEKPIIHGYVSLAYGWGSDGQTYREGSLYVTHENPRTGTLITVGSTVIDTKGGRCR